MGGDGSDIRLTTTTTGTVLLSALRDTRNHKAWHSFCQRYRPLIVRYARSSFSLSEADAEDAAQNTLEAFHRAYRRGDYDRGKGRLRHWLFGISTNQIRSLKRKKRSLREARVADMPSRTGLFESIPDAVDLEEQWEHEWRQAVYRQCMAEVQQQFNPKTVEAFTLFAKDGLSARDVAARLGITPNAVYLAKQHILKRIRELLPYVEEAF